MSGLKLAERARTPRPTFPAERYELREKLASSTTATVWRALDRKRRLEVALKVANPDAADISGRQLLAAELDVAHRLDHPNIVPVSDAYFDGGEAALAFPLIEGETLARRLARGGRLPPLEAARIAADVGAALAHAHGRGVVHRDVKPGNVLLGADGRARLFDFGISATPENAAGHLVEPGMTTGTLPYMAPEQLAGESPHPATDIYALGAVLYEMLAGHRPYEAATTDELAVLQQQPPPHIGDAPPKLAELALLALDPDPLVRPRASVLAARLRAWADSSTEQETVVVPIAPSTSVVPAASGGAARRSRAGSRLSGLAGVVAALVVVGVVAGGLALAVATSRPGASDVVPTTYPGVVMSPLPTLPWPPSPTPATLSGGGGSSGGGHSDNGSHGRGDHGGKGKGH